MPNCFTLTLKGEKKPDGVTPVLTYAPYRRIVEFLKEKFTTDAWYQHR